MITYINNHKKIFAIAIPDDASCPWVINNGTERVGLNWYIPRKSFDGNTWSEGFELPAFKSYELICLSDEYTEEQAQEILGNPPYMLPNDYEGVWLQTAKEGLERILISKGIISKHAILKQVK